MLGNVIFAKTEIFFKNWPVLHKTIKNEQIPVLGASSCSLDVPVKEMHFWSR